MRKLIKKTWEFLGLHPALSIFCFALFYTDQFEFAVLVILLRNTLARVVGFFGKSLKYYKHKAQ